MKRGTQMWHFNWSGDLVGMGGKIVKYSWELNVPNWMNWRVCGEDGAWSIQGNNETDNVSTRWNLFRSKWIHSAIIFRVCLVVGRSSDLVTKSSHQKINHLQSPCQLRSTNDDRTRHCRSACTHPGIFQRRQRLFRLENHDPRQTEKWNLPPPPYNMPKEERREQIIAEKSNSCSSGIQSNDGNVVPTRISQRLFSIRFGRDKVI